MSDEELMEFKKLDRWNPVTERYEPFIVPADRKVAVYATDMNTEVQCAECGKKMKYGDGYTSRWIHTQHGFGYCVCEDCYNIELSTEMKLRGR